MLIGLHGRKQAGKDTVFERATWLMRDVIVVERVSFADLLYRSAAASLGVTVAELQVWKADPRVVVTVSKPGPKSIGWTRELANKTVREYLQSYGTEAHRQVFGTDFWVDQVDLSHEGRIVMVTDVRFENEARAVIAAGGRVVRVVGPDTGEADGHASEVPLDEALVWGTLQNIVRGDDYRTLDGQVQTMLRLALNGTARRVWRGLEIESFKADL